MNQWLNTILNDCEQGECVIAAIMARKKENDILDSTRTHRAVLTPLDTPGGFYQNGLQKLLDISRGSNLDWRPYVSLNKRDARTATSETIRKQVSSFECKYDHDMPWTASLFKSELMKKNARSERKYMLVDVDTRGIRPENVSSTVRKSGADALFYKTKTPNGYHIVYNKFDSTTFSDHDDIEVHNDAMVYTPDLFEELKKSVF